MASQVNTHPPISKLSRKTFDSIHEGIKEGQQQAREYPRFGKSFWFSFSLRGATRYNS
jgi:hypothetical protein